MANDLDRALDALGAFLGGRRPRRPGRRPARRRRRPAPAQPQPEVRPEARRVVNGKSQPVAFSRCKICRERGHNVRTCPKKETTPAAPTTQDRVLAALMGRPAPPLPSGASNTSVSIWDRQLDAADWPPALAAAGLRPTRQTIRRILACVARREAVLTRKGKTTLYMKNKLTEGEDRCIRCRLRGHTAGECDLPHSAAELAGSQRADIEPARLAL